MKKVLVLGAGLTGLTASYKLLKKGFQVTLLEKEEKVGGLAAGFKKENWAWSLEKFYHHFFTSDYSALKLAKNLNLQVIFKKPLTALYFNNQILPFDSPLHLLTFPYLNLTEKLKTGISLAYLKLTPFWQKLEKETAKNWLIKNQGERIWQILWQPLFLAKFGQEYEQITASWFWARIKKRSVWLGYPAGGFQHLANLLAQQIKNKKGKMFLNLAVCQAIYHNKTWQVKAQNQKTKKTTVFSAQTIISTLPTPVFLRVFPQLPKNYTSRLAQIKYLHSLNLLLILKKPFLPKAKKQAPYWLNINDSSFPFLALIEHTNFMDKKNYANCHLLYISNYLPLWHSLFELSGQKLLTLFTPYLQKINPSFNLKWVLNIKRFSAFFSQPIINTNYPSLRPDLKTPLPNLYLGNLDTVYPWDRGTNYAVETGEKLADLVSY